MSAKPHSQFGDYELLEEIARGGMGVVYKARQVSLNRTVALKMILSGQFASDQDVGRFYQEAESAANLDHPAIVPIYEIGEYEGHHFFSMKYVEGGSLADSLVEIRESRREAIALIAEVARAVHHAHQRGILHRDLKPANILLDDSGKPLVSDLGLAKQIQSDSNLTHTGAVVGTPAYMPPEQAAAKKEITTAADIYSLGAILYEILTGRTPHQGDSPMATLMQVLEADIIPPREVDGRVDRALSLVCMKCLDRDPNQRYSSAAALADDLDRWLQGESVSVRPPSMGSAVVDVLRANLRTAAGAALIGVIAGICFAYCFSRIHSEGAIRENPPLAIYEALPAPMPPGRALAFMKEEKGTQRAGLLALLGLLLCGASVGVIVTTLTRPKPGSEAFSLGLVTALFMSIAVFTLDLGFGAVRSTHEPVRKKVSVLANAALGTSTQATAAREQLFEEYPGLEQLTADERAKTLSYRIFYDGIYEAPLNMFVAMFMSAVLCVVPCVGGTTFASKLSSESHRLWQSVPAYLEFMFAVGFFAIYSFRQTLFSVGALESNTGAVDRWVRPACVLLLLVMMLVMQYRRQMTWRWRLALYPLLFLMLTISL